MKITQSIFFKAILLILFLSSVACTSEKKKDNFAENSKPNIILIVADDLGYNDLSCYGNKFIETPNLDQLAKQGIQFMQAYAAAPLCSPTRASIQTGLHPARLGMTEHIRGHPKAQPWMKVQPVNSVQGLDTSYLSLPEMLKQANYYTGHIGKWHLGGGICLPISTGYDFNFAGNWAGLPRSFHYPFFDKGVLEELKSYAKEGSYLTDVLTDRAIEFIDDQKDDPFFLHLAYYSPHVPIEAKPNWVEYYQEKRKPRPDSLLPNVHYAAMVSSIDENVGRIMEKLEASELEENTLIIFTSDNGGLSVKEVPGYDKHTPPTDNGPLRDGKGYLAEGGIREPYIFRWPNKIKGSRKSSLPIMSTDFFSTFAEITDQTHRTEDGISLLPTLLGNGQAEKRSLFWHHPHYSPQRGKPCSAILNGDYKLIYYYEDENKELFNLKNDPSEEKDLSNVNKSLRDSLFAELEQWQRSVNAKLPKRNPNYEE